MPHSTSYATPRARVGKFCVVFFLLIFRTFPAFSQIPEKYNGHGDEVMLQGFHWTSYDPTKNGNKPWYQIMKENAGVIQQAQFDLVWFPPPSASSASDNAYMPNEWYTLQNGYGTQQQLQDAIAALKTDQGSHHTVGAICDIVVNHRCGTKTGGSDFTNPSFGSDADNAAAIVTGDDCNCGTGQPEERHHDGIPCEGNTYARDLDHTNPNVQNKVKEFEGKLKVLGFVGWRYDDVKGYGGWHVGDYNDASAPLLSVGEFYDDTTQNVVDWVDETTSRSMAFDFPTRDALVAATLLQDYSRLKTEAGKPPGVIGMWSSMAVTFIENHDTEPVRDNGNKRFPDDKIMQGYAYILTHPGVPCVFWNHFFDQGDDQKNKIIKLIAIRKAQGINSRSTVWIEPNNTVGKYAAIIDNKVAMKIGHADWSPGQGWQLQLDGPDYAVWTKQ